MPVREASAALQTLAAGSWFSPWMWDSPALSESPATQEEIQRTINSERRRRATPLSPAPETKAAASAQAITTAIDVGDVEDLFTKSNHRTLGHLRLQ